MKKGLCYLSGKICLIKVWSPVLRSDVVLTHSSTLTLSTHRLCCSVSPTPDFLRHNYYNLRRVLSLQANINPLSVLVTMPVI